MKPFALLGYDADHQVWQKVREYDTPGKAMLGYHEVVTTRLYQLVALVRCWDCCVLVATTETNLSSLPEFCAAATR